MAMAVLDLFRSATREPSRATLFARGTAALVTLVLTVGLLYLYGQGAFADKWEMATVVDDAGGSLVVGSDVKYDGVVIGKVASLEFEPGPAGATSTRIALDLVPEDARHVPADVAARVLPASVFGTSFVDLVAAERKGVLRAGAMIPQDRSQATLELQKVLDGLDEVATSLGPAELSSALNAMATALDGNGERLGETIERFEEYLRKLNPAMPAVRRNLDLLSTNLEAFEDHAPDLFVATDHALKTARTLVDQEANLRQIARRGATTMTDVNRLLRTNEKNLVDALIRTAVTVDALYDGRRGVSEGVLAFLDLSERFGDALSEGRYLKIRGQLVLDVGETYGPQDCPSYGSHRGRGC